MANSDKNILITPNKNLEGLPETTFTGAGNSSISIKIPNDNTGTLAFESSGTRLFTIDTNLSSNDVFKTIHNTTGMPIFRVDVNGNVIFSPTSGLTKITGNGISLKSYDTESLPNGEEGLIVYDKTLKIVKIFNDTKWVDLGIPQLVVGGLTVRLEAGDIRSYPGTGSVWYDLSGLNNNCNWVNRPNFDYRGFFRFDGSDDYGEIGFNSSLNTNAGQTIMMVLRHNYNSGRRNPWNQAYGGYGTWTHEQGDSMSWYFGDAGANASPYIGHGTENLVRSKWNIIASVRDPSTYFWHINGVKGAVQNHGYGILTDHSSSILIGSGYAGLWQGDMGVVLLYNRKLSDAELTQNYNVLRTTYPSNN